MTGVEHPNGDRLDSWKAIAAYLGRDEGTLRRWEQTRGLPIRRVPGRKGGSVYAFSAEVDAWLQSQPAEASSAQVPDATSPPPAAVPHVFNRRRMAFGAATVAIGVLLAGWWWLALPRASAGGLTLEVSEEAITAKDGRGEIAWVHPMGEASRHIRLQASEFSRVLLGSRPQAFVATEIRFRRSDNLVESGRLSAFALNGSPQWDFEFDDAVTIGDTQFGAPWGLTAFAVSGAGNARRIAVTAHHYTWSASLVAILDDNGRRHGSYVNDGWLEALRWLAPDRLALSGFSQSKNGGLVVLVDPAGLTNPGAQSPEDDPAHQCGNCGPGRPLRMAVMPRTDVNRATGSRFNRATMEHVGDRLLVRTVEAPGGALSPAEAIYEFTPGLELVGASFSDRYWEMHDQLFASGVLDHDRAHCPDRSGPPRIESWAPATGWTTRNVR